MQTISLSVYRLICELSQVSSYLNQFRFDCCYANASKVQCSSKFLSSSKPFFELACVYPKFLTPQFQSSTLKSKSHPLMLIHLMPMIRDLHRLVVWRFVPVCQSIPPSVSHPLTMVCYHSTLPSRRYHYRDSWLFGLFQSGLFWNEITSIKSLQLIAPFHQILPLRSSNILRALSADCLSVNHPTEWTWFRSDVNYHYYHHELSISFNSIEFESQFRSIFPLQWKIVRNQEFNVQCWEVYLMLIEEFWKLLQQQFLHFLMISFALCEIHIHIPWSTSGLKKVPWMICQFCQCSLIPHQLSPKVLIQNLTHCLCSMWTVLPLFHSKLINSTAFAFTWLTESNECEFSLGYGTTQATTTTTTTPANCPNGMNGMLPALSIWLCVLSRDRENTQS